MPLDPSTLCARTAAGDAELAAPRHGLAIAQRRLLSLLDHPSPFDELSRRPGVLPDRVEKDLARLAERGLVELHAPSAPGGAPPRPSVKPAPPPPETKPDAPRSWIPAQPGLSASITPPAPESRVILGRRVRRGRALMLGFLTLCAVGAAIWWLAAPSQVPDRTASPAAPVASIAPAPVPALPTPRAPELPAAVPEPTRVVAVPESFVTLPATAVPPATPAASGASRPAPAALPPPAATPELPAAPPARTRPVATSPEVTVEANPAPQSASAEQAPAAAAVSVPPTVAPPGLTTLVPPPAAPVGATAAPATVPAAVPAAMTVPPVQLASAAPSALPAKTAPPRLEPLSREAPAFPREALASGITKGTVRARLSIDASGKVTGVEVLESQPRRVFDRAVMRALGRWSYEPGEPSRTADVEIAFNRD